MEDSVNRHSVECSGTLPDAAGDGLSGADLDAAVARAEGHTEIEVEMIGRKLVCQVVLPGEDGQNYWTDYSPSTEWDAGGSIIEREGVSLQFVPGGNGDAAFWAASLPHGTMADPEGGTMTNFASAYAETPLIAAMRAYVASAAPVDVTERSTE